MDLLFQIKRGNETVGENKGNGVYSITKNLVLWASSE